MLEMIEDYAFPQRLVLAVNLRSILVEKFMDTTFASGVCKILSHLQNERDSAKKNVFSAISRPYVIYVYLDRLL